jgi:hypothetical protein
MGQDLNVSSWVTIRHGCSITCRRNGADVEFLLGSPAAGFEFVFDVGALREFVAVSQAAIQDSE